MNEEQIREKVEEATLDFSLGEDDLGVGFAVVDEVEQHVGAFLRVLDQVVDTTVLARPRVTCLNRQGKTLHA